MAVGRYLPFAPVKGVERRRENTPVPRRHGAGKAGHHTAGRADQSSGYRGRERLYDFVRRTSATVLVISHDRTLLNLLPAICELSRNGLAYYGGNYDFYKEQKEVHRNALQQQLEEKEKTLRLARKTAREVEERKARQNTRGEKASIKKGIPRILLGGLKNHAENSSSRLSNVHAEKAGKIQQEITSLKGSLSRTDKLKTDFNAPALHTGKILVTARDINFHYPDSDANLWPAPLSFQLRSGSRLCIKGNNAAVRQPC